MGGLAAPPSDGISPGPSFDFSDFCDFYTFVYRVNLVITDAPTADAPRPSVSTKTSGSGSGFAAAAYALYVFGTSQPRVSLSSAPDASSSTTSGASPSSVATFEVTFASGVCFFQAHHRAAAAAVFFQSTPKFLTSLPTTETVPRQCPSSCHCQISSPRPIPNTGLNAPRILKTSPKPPAAPAATKLSAHQPKPSATSASSAPAVSTPITPELVMLFPKLPADHDLFFGLPSPRLRCPPCFGPLTASPTVPSCTPPVVPHLTDLT